MSQSEPSRPFTAAQDHVLVFCSGDHFIGTGHVTRSYALAQALIRHGLSVNMSGNVNEPEWLHNLISPYFVPLAQAVQTNPSLIVIDSYDAKTFDEVNRHFPDVPQVHIVDDSTPRRVAEAYIEPGINTSWLPPLEARSAPRLSGAEAVLIRDELRMTSESTVHYLEQESLSVLVSLGGSDGYGVRSQVVDALVETGLPCRISVISPEPIEASVVEGQSLSTVSPGAGLKGVTTSSDLVISAAGVSSWEFLHQGKPTALLCAVDNQEANYQFMTESAIALGLGRTYTGETLNLGTLQAFVTSPKARSDYGIRASEVVDGLGSDRAAVMIRNVIRSLAS